MARPVKETPILRGRDAEAFARAINENKSKKVSKEEYARAMATYERVLKDSNL
jgi:hypothetical protein